MGCHLGLRFFLCPLMVDSLHLPLFSFIISGELSILSRLLWYQSELLANQPIIFYNVSTLLILQTAQQPLQAIRAIVCTSSCLVGSHFKFLSVLHCWFQSALRFRIWEGDEHATHFYPSCNDKDSTTESTRQLHKGCSRRFPHKTWTSPSAFP